jgi:hypothetical protein
MVPFFPFFYATCRKSNTKPLWKNMLSLHTKYHMPSHGWRPRFMTMAIAEFEGSKPHARIARKNGILWQQFIKW